MANTRLWHLAQQLRQVASVKAEASGLWNDQSGSHIHGRYLRPHDQSATGQVDDLRAHDGALERVGAAVREAQAHYEESRIAGELVVRETHEAEYAVSVTHDFIRRGLTNEGRAAQLQDQAVGAAEQANALGASAPGEHGQSRVAISYTALQRVSGGGGGASAAGIASLMTPKKVRQAAARGWTREQIGEAIQSGQQVRAVNKANGSPATRYVHPTTGQSVVVEHASGQIIHVGGPGFAYGPASGDLP